MLTHVLILKIINKIIFFWIYVNIINILHDVRVRTRFYRVRTQI